MPNGKRAGEACLNLDMTSLRCTIWQSENYPELCKRFIAEESICGESREEALHIIQILEIQTQPTAKT